MKSKSFSLYNILELNRECVKSDPHRHRPDCSVLELPYIKYMANAPGMHAIFEI